MRFNTGDFIIHPVHGAGVIKFIETKEVFDEELEYYIIELLLDSINKIMIPVEKAVEIGIRKAENNDKISAIFDVLSTKSEIEIKDLGNWNSNYKYNVGKIQSGDIIEVAKIFKHLFNRSQNRELGMKDNDMMDKSRKLVVSELILANHITEIEANVLINNALKLSVDEDVH
ncbi:MAG: hypothetical protein CVV64_05705 [Candidatus Wallbacteria bacterium HGW-Wallbacteria-1]|jgi:CarD family transcriptional regulator|uniref:CarD-like/TRCF RNAP-interacting domain-containing protein n=1 Tax=Candidatus Wallbacteria bacterium HGW-Wallbacteria-1 TaxID=2013854 RepID=A0A2N1PSF3_9BACT|nr:MAG: hypothetical protein CVV64_05705 [Candidatus Wallbacteria bacterium HGW-Wallbacteria-1]